MPDLIRLSLSIENSLYDRLEKMVKQSGYTNRSEFVRDMIRRQLVEKEWEKGKEVLATITLVYDHHKPNLTEKLTHMQHHHHGKVLASTHVHLDKAVCAEMILVKGKVGEVRRLADKMRQQKGVLHAEMSMTSTGTSLK
ncbi:MAG: nickel-responsive transcriptional regulator NikR [Planctomycetota bacterium]|nr:MAG: nickel-responsive transcriptional regulator NikR [Planctomycetota bacterium]